MDFDEFDAPQFVDFSKENFDASHEGDSWFSSDDSASDLEIEEFDAEEEEEEEEEKVEEQKEGVRDDHQRQAAPQLPSNFAWMSSPQQVSVELHRTVGRNCVIKTHSIHR